MKILSSAVTIPALILISCKKEISPIPAGKAVDSVKVEKTADSTKQMYPRDEFEHIDSTEQFLFGKVLHIKSLNDTIMQIAVVNRKDGKLVQKIPCPYYGSFRVDQDMNFDGINDLSYVTVVDFNSDYWIYQPKVNQFEIDSVLSNAVNPSVRDSSKHELFCYSGCAVGCTEETYRFFNGKAALVFSKVSSIGCDTIGYEEKPYILLEHTKLVNGKMKRVLYQKVSADSGLKGLDPSDYPQKKRTN